MEIKYLKSFEEAEGKEILKTVICAENKTLCIGFKDFSVLQVTLDKPWFQAKVVDTPLTEIVMGFIWETKKVPQ